MATTFQLISSYTVGLGGVSNIELTGIPNTFTDLCLIASIASNRGVAGENARVQFNGDTGSNYSTRRIYGTGSSASSDIDGGSALISLNFGATGDGLQANTFGNGVLYVSNYTGSTYKSIASDSLGEANQIEEYMAFNAGRWNSSSAITSIKLIPQVGSLWKQYSTIYLYGIKNS